MSSIIERLTKFLIVNEIIEDVDEDIYRYGLRQGILIIINVMTTVLIGLFLRSTWESILFLATYIPLRTYGGGYHAKTEGKCYFFSLVLTSVVLLAIKSIPTIDLIVLCLTGVGVIIVLLLAPIEDSNNPLNEKEKVIYKRKARKILIIETLIIVALLVLSFKEIALVMSVSICTLSFMLILGMLRNKNQGISQDVE